MHIRHLTSPGEVWRELEKLYAPRDSKYRIVQLRRKLYSIKLSDYESMEVYLGQINETVAELANVGHQVEDGNLAMTILCGLSEEWDTAASALCNLPEDEFKCSTIKGRILAEATRRRENTEGKHSAMVMKTNNPTFQHRKEKQFEKGKSETQQEVNCFKCQKPGHISRNCRNKKTFERHRFKPRNMNVALSTAICDANA